MKKLLFVVSSAENILEDRARKLSEHLNANGWQTEVAFITEKAEATITARLKGVMKVLWRTFRNAYEAVYIIDTGPYHALLILLLWASKGVTGIIDVGDLASEMGRRSGRPKLLCWILKFSQLLTDRLAGHVVVRSTYHRDMLLNRGIRSVLHLPDGVDTKRFSPCRNPALKSSLGLDDALVVGVLGSISKSYQYGYDVVEVVARLKQLPVKGLVIGGSGELLEQLKQHAQSLGIAQRVVFTGRVPLEELPAYLNLADVCLLTRPDELWSRIVTTGKLPLYLACGRYIVASAVGEIARIFQAHPVGYSLPVEGDQAAYYDRVSRHIQTLLSDRQKMENAAKCGRDLALQQFDYSVIAKKLSDFLKISPT